MSLRLGIKDFLQEARFRAIIDVRSPAEFAHAHIPGALNLPLFSDEERALVGTLYKQENPHVAFRKGLKIAGKKMSWYLEEINRLAGGKKLAVHCWRGGKRSDSLGWLFGMAGYDVVILEGGYKSFRSYASDFFSACAPKFIVLGGKTGSGKTEILTELKNQGEQIVDLERLAIHKGSAFGNLSNSLQPMPEHFENLVFQAMYDLDFSRRIWLENESRAIGKVFIPPAIWSKKIVAPLIHIEVSLDVRVERLVQDYAGFSKEELVAAFMKIQKRLGGLRLKNALDCIDKNDFAGAAKIGLEYYDKTYNHCLDTGSFSKIFSIEITENNPVKTAEKVIQFADNHIFK